MRSEPSIGTGEAAGSEPVWHTVTNRIPTAIAVLVAAFTLVGLVVAGTGGVAADETAELDSSVVTASEDGADGESGSGDGGDDGNETDGSDGDEESSEPATVTRTDVEAADVVVPPEETDVGVPVEVDDGETVTLRVRSAGDTSPSFIMTEETTVENGAANATFDLSRTAHGDRATLTVRGNEALNESNSREMLVVDESIGVEEDGGVLDLETPGFGVVAGGLAVLVVALAARRRE